MASARIHDPFAALIPAAAERMPVAWRQLHIPGPPRAFELRHEETSAAQPRARFERRTIQLLDCGGEMPCAADAGNGPATRPDRLALVDKASPHARFDLMLTEASDITEDQPPKAHAGVVTPETGQTLWRTGLEFVRFVSDAGTRRAFGLDGGQVSLALNCDPYTEDRESVQALKQFHLHLMYWGAQELAQLRPRERLEDYRDVFTRRQCLDPLTFLAERLVYERLADFDIGIAGAQVMRPDLAEICIGIRPLGTLLRLPGWDVLAQPAFESLIRRLHRCLEDTASALRQAFTGDDQQPLPWERHRLLAPSEIGARLEALGLSTQTRAGLLTLAQALRDLGPATGARLRAASPATRKHCMSLNQPCYSMSLSVEGPQDLRLPPGAAKSVVLSIQPRLFSGIGGAGLLSLCGVPSVRILRGNERFPESDWRLRARFQHAFAMHNTAALEQQNAGRRICSSGPPRELRNFDSGWT